MTSSPVIQSSSKVRNKGKLRPKPVIFYKNLYSLISSSNLAYHHLVERIYLTAVDHVVSAVKVISETDQYHIFQISARVPSDVYWIGPIDFSPWIPG